MLSVILWSIDIIFDSWSNSCLFLYLKEKYTDKSLNGIESKVEMDKPIYKILAAALKLSVEKLQGSDNFFELGGNSLSAVYAVSEIKKCFPCVKLSIAEFFEFSTVQELVDKIHGEEIGEESNTMEYDFIKLSESKLEYI